MKAYTGEIAPHALVLESNGSTYGSKGRPVIQERSFTFAVLVIDFVALLRERNEFDIARQVLRCGTSIGANVHEAQCAESPKDFLHKMKLAGKEAYETIYWLSLCEASDRLPEPGSLLDESRQLASILSRIIITTKRRLNR